MMINELSIQPFNKLNCVGMLNTLLPPTHTQTKPPSPLLDVKTLQRERDGFFEYIRLVQKNGPDVMQTVKDMNKGLEDENGWPAVQRIVDKYLKVSKQLIDDCLATAGPESFERYSDNYKTSKKEKKDSGISFGSSTRRPSVGSSLHEQQVPEPMPTFSASVKGPSTLERITREFRRMRVKPRPEIEEIVQIKQRALPGVPPQLPESSSKKSLKKARSLASLKFGNGSSLSLSSRKGSEQPSFNAKEMQKHRQLYEASLGKR